MPPLQQVVNKFMHIYFLKKKVPTNLCSFFITKTSTEISLMDDGYNNKLLIS
jgi:hypothetical protein